MSTSSIALHFPNLHPCLLYYTSNKWHTTIHDVFCSFSLRSKVSNPEQLAMVPLSDHDMLVLTFYSHPSTNKFCSPLPSSSIHICVSYMPCHAPKNRSPLPHPFPSLSSEVKKKTAYEKDKTLLT
jgi:hypothetical protein